MCIARVLPCPHTRHTPSRVMPAHASYLLPSNKRLPLEKPSTMFRPSPVVLSPCRNAKPLVSCSVWNTVISPTSKPRPWHSSPGKGSSMPCKFVVCVQSRVWVPPGAVEASRSLSLRKGVPDPPRGARGHAAWFPPRRKRRTGTVRRPSMGATSIGLAPAERARRVAAVQTQGQAGGAPQALACEPPSS